tara:strand:+ start:5191 stop:5895 length:705 start_codon:yes stop_codon:yes gene_type:complete
MAGLDYMSLASSPMDNWKNSTENNEFSKGSFDFAPQELNVQATPDLTPATWAAFNKSIDLQNERTARLGLELDAVAKEFYTGQDIRKGQALGQETRMGYETLGEQDRAARTVSGEQDRATRAEGGSQDRALARVGGQEERAGFAEQGSQNRATSRVEGQEERGIAAERGAQERAGMRVLGQEDRGRTAEEGAQSRAGQRVAGDELRTTELQREQFRRYKENTDYEQGQRAARAY